MRLQLNKKSENQRGEIMLEASIILVLVLIMLFAILSLTFFYYQEALMVTIATETASDIGKNYKFADIGIGDNDISLTDVENAKMFRMSFAKNSLERAHKTRAQNYGNWRISLATLGFNSGDLHADCEIKYSGLGRAYVEVTVSQNTDFFLSGVLEMLHIVDDNQLFSASVTAECADLMAYTSMVNFVEYASGVFDEFNSIGHLYTSVRDFADKLIS